jgi:RNA-binding protein
MTKHELLKIKIRADDKHDRQTMIDEIVSITQAHLIQVIGNIMVIYRAFNEEPQIILPRK